MLLKLARSQPATEAELARLAHEFNLLQRIDSDRVVKAYALEKCAAAWALVLEDVAGHPLDQDLPVNGLSVDVYLTWALQAAQALVDIHRLGIIHKDIKPQSILVNLERTELRLIDFAAASTISREHLAFTTAGRIEGTLPYMAPEQTGRIQRPLDGRSDLYSLGVTFYQVLTGRLPFAANDPLEWVHCHIARTPPPLAALRPGLPPMLSAIVLKLLAKEADERYQSAASLLADLRRFKADWEHGRLAPGDAFVLAQQDPSWQFRLTSKLYGREQEHAFIQAALARVAGGGAAELLLVHGYSGVGKSALVREALKPAEGQPTLLLSGKFAARQRDIPYFSLTQALDGVVQHVLAAPETARAAWRLEILAAVGDFGALIVQLLPRLVALIGPQPAVDELAPGDLKLRFKTTLQRFIAVFQRAERPLLLFLDDLQWADAASLDVLHDILSQPSTKHLLVIGAYRDQEVSPEHPLTAALTSLSRAGARVADLPLHGISLDALNQLLSDTLACSAADAQPLALLLHEKTAGNPLFATRLLWLLYEEQLIFFDHELRRWLWDSEQISAKGFSDNVADLLVGKIKRLPAAAQKALRVAACIGPAMSFARLAQACTWSVEATEQALWPAASAKLILFSSDGLHFPHDRIQEAAYQLNSAAEAKALHYRLAWQLREAAPEQLFEVVGHLNLAKELLVASAERLAAAELNLAAGRQARASIAYLAAAAYFAQGLDLLPPDAWTALPDLTLQLSYGLAECAFLSSQPQRAAGLLAAILAHCRDLPARAQAYALKVGLHTTQGEMTNAVACAFEGLASLGIHLPLAPTDAEVERGYREVWELLGARRIEDLLELPLATDHHVKGAMAILSAMYAAAYFTNANLNALHICKLVSLSMQHGHGVDSSSGFACFSMLLNGDYGRHREGYQFAKLGIALTVKHGYMSQHSKASFYAEIAAFWTEPLAVMYGHIDDALRGAQANGDLMTACFAGNHIIADRIVGGEALDLVFLEAERRIAYAEKAGFHDVCLLITSMRQYVQNMRGLTNHFSTFSDAGIHEEALDAEIGRAQMATMVCWHHIYKLMARYMSGDLALAREASAKAKPLLWASLAHVQLHDFVFYDALTIARTCDLPDYAAVRADDLRTLQEHQLRFAGWAAVNPGTFLGKYQLICAELARLHGRRNQAAELYAKASAAATAGGFGHVAALIDERAGDFFAAWGMPVPARAYLRQALEGYTTWGALGKAAQLIQAYPELLRTAEAPKLGSYPTFRGAPEQLDLLAVVKASQRISQQMQLGELMSALLTDVVTHAGAQEGYLLRPRAGAFSIIATASSSGGGLTAKIAGRDEAQPNPAVTQDLLHLLRPTRDARDEAPPLAAILPQRPGSAKSRMYLPISRGGEMLYVLYLENNLVADAFTLEKKVGLELVAAQAAISFENAKLFGELQESREKLSAALDHMVEAVYACDAEFRINLINESAAQSSGYARAELLQQDVRELARRMALRDSQGREVPHDELPLMRALKGEVIRGFEGLLQAAGRAQPVYLQVSAAPVRDQHGQVIGAVSVSQDVTELKGLDLLKDQLLRVAAHELKTPVTLVRGYTQLLSQSLKQASAHEQWVIGRIIDGSDRIATLVNELLDVSLLQTARMPMQFVPLDLKELVPSSIAAIAAQADRVFAFHCAEAEAQDWTVRGDRERLAQCVASLLRNAVQYSSAGSRIDIELAAAGEWLTIAIADCGVGIPLAKQAGMFQPFYRAHTDTPFDYGGMGVGLYTAKEIISAHGGQLSFVSQEHLGSTFFVRLPRLLAQG